MPWTNQPGNGSGNPPPGNTGNGGRGPWGRGPTGGGGGGGQPPDFEEMLRRAQDRLKNILPGNFGGPGIGGGGLAVIALAVAAVWLISGIYIVSASEQGVVLRFGQFVSRTAPGINYHLPWPIETVTIVDVTRPRQITIGYHAAGTARSEASVEDVAQEGLMLTGDENIVNVNFVIYWVVKDAVDYTFKVENPDLAVRAVAESAMREVVGKNPIEPILTQDREPIQREVRDLMQKTLDTYGAGVAVTDVKMQKVDPPDEVLDAYRDVQAARADQERMRNEAEAYANKIIPEARGKAASIVQGAQAYKQRVTAEASGEAKRFLSVYEEYRKAPDVTRKRMYLETMSEVYAGSNKVLIDDSVKGVVPYLPLSELKSNSNKSVTVTERPMSSAQPVAQPSTGAAQ
ncbi:MAG TPA: FtsH protease activity modulator HflK [Rhizomicrobium sp.]|nr:FtsH protease activity modulator HflK [Rhizomicrobium sp.]